MVVPSDAGGRGAPAQRAQPGPRRRHGLARPRRPRLQLPARRPRRGARRRPGRAARRAARRPRPGRRPLRASAWPGSRACEAPIAGARRGAAQLVRLPVRLAAEADRDATIAAPRRARRSPARPTCPASTSSRTCASSATARASSRSPKRPSRALAGAALLPGDDRGPGRPGVRGSRRNAARSRLMSRFRKDPDPRFWRLNRSIEFDWRLAPYDIDQSQAHARGLREIGVLDDEELEQIDAGLERVRARMGEHGFEFDDADEDIHMAIERLLGEEIGPLAGKLHTGRSRNDQVATDVAMVVQAHSLRAIELSGAAMERLLALAERHRDWPMPGYTHLQRAQPVYLGHHLLAYFWMLARDVLRFQFALDSASGDAARLGRPGRRQLGDRPPRGRRRPRLRARQPQLDRRRLQPRLRPRLPGRRLGLRDAPLAARLGDRDLVEQRVRLLRARRVLLLGLLDHAAEGEPRLGRAAARQERRASPPTTRRCSARCTRCRSPTARTCRRTRSRSSTRSTRSSSASTRPRACSPGSSSTASGWRQASGDEMLAATEIADLLVRKGVPFREAHGIVGGLVRDAVEQGKRLSELQPRGAAAALRAPRRVLLRGAGAQQLAGVEADRGRHRLRGAGQADRAGRARPWRRSRRGSSKSGSE